MTEADWLALEDALFRLTAAELRSFAASHRGETFYGFAFSCEGVYGELKLALNTEDDLSESARSTTGDWAGLADVNRATLDRRLAEMASDLPPPTPEEIEREFRWGPDAWKYPGFESDGFRTAWAPFADAVLEARHEDPDWTSTDTAATRRFLRSACRVLLRLERERVFDVLNRTADFKGLVRGQWDTEEDAWERLNSVRAEAG